MTSAPWTPQQTLQFKGTLGGQPPLSFTVLAGTGGPTPTGGFANISQIARPQRKAFTYATGYDALSMDVPIRFEAMTSYDNGWTPAQIEDNIMILEWMAGRGQLYPPGQAAKGQPPIVQVSSFDAFGNATNLIPPNFHSEGTSPPDVRWLISALQYDPNPIRGRGGDRHQQDVVVSLVEYTPVPGEVTSPAVRQAQRPGSPSYMTFTSTAAQDTIAKVCIAQGVKNASDWAQVVGYNLSRLKVRGYTQQLPPSTKVQIPSGLLPAIGEGLVGPQHGFVR